MVVQKNGSEPDFEKKLSPGLEYELDTLPLPQSDPFGKGKIKDKVEALLGLSTQPALRKQQIKNLVAEIGATARGKTEAETFNRLLTEGIRKDKEDMMVGERPRALMALFSVIAKLKTNTGGIKNPAAYLAGILRKPRAEQRGYQSLAATVASMPDPGCDKIQQAIDPATMHDDVFARGRELFGQIEPWRQPPESKRELVGRFNVFFNEIMGDCHPLAKKDLTDQHGHWSIPIVLSVRLSNLQRQKDGSSPIRSEAAYVKTLSKKDRLDNAQAYVDAILAKAGVDLVATGIVARGIEELPGSERCRRARAPEQNFQAHKFPLVAIGDIVEDVAKHSPLDVAEMRKISAKIKKGKRGRTSSRSR